MSRTTTHIIEAKCRNGIMKYKDAPISNKLKWDRSNFDRGYFRRLRKDKMAKQFILIVFTALLFVGCKSAKEIQYIDRYNKINTIDSIYIHQTDSFIQTQKGDTIFRDRWKTFYKDRIVIKKDSAYFNITKTVQVPIEVVKYKWSTANWIYFIISLLTLFYISIKLYFKFKPTI